MSNERESLKIEVWQLIEKHRPGLSDEIGWGSMDSLCDELISFLYVAPKPQSKSNNKEDV